MARIRTSIALIAIAALAVGSRSLPFRQVFQDGSVRFFEGDNYLHLRKILLQLREFPSFVGHDYFVGYPVGTGNIKPPLIDYLISLASLVLGAGDPSVRLVETVAAVVPPLVGGLTVVVVFVLARRLFGSQVAYPSAILLAFMPSHMVFTFIGRPDNEMMEPLMVSLLFLAYLELQASQEAGRSAGLRAALVTGSVALLTLLFWRGASLWIAVVALGALMETTIEFLQGRRSSRSSLLSALAFAFLSAFLSVLCALNIFGNMDGFTYNIVSWFHALVFGGVAAGLYAYGRFCSFWLRRDYSRPSFFVALLSCLAVLAVFSLYVVPAVGQNLARAFTILGFGERDPWVESLLEYRSLVSGGVGEATTKFGWMFGWGVVLLPGVVAVIAYQACKNEIDRGRLFFAIAALLAFALGLSRTRFINVLSIFVAIASGWLLHRLYRAALANSGFDRLALRRIWAWMVTVALCVVLFHPLGVMAYRAPRATAGNPISRPAMETLLWLRDHTPPPGDVYEPGAFPPYAVMAIWNYGSWINYIAERASVSTVYGSETHGMRESAAFFTATDEEEANALLEASGARYVLVHELGGMAKTLGEIAQRSTVDYTNLEEYLGLVSIRLFVADGVRTSLESVVLEGLDHYRLAFESLGVADYGLPSGAISVLKVFEHVPGAVVVVETAPGSPITATARIRTNRSRVFEFAKSAVADASGTATLILPYSLWEGPAAAGLASPYRIASGSGSTDLWLTEEDVLQGRTIELSLPNRTW